MPRTIPRILITLLLATAACSTSSDASDTADLTAAEVVPDGIATADEFAPVTGTLQGRIVDAAGSPIAKALLVLCGFVDGKEVCNQRKTEADGVFIYDDIVLGYTHLQVLPYAATADSGVLYAGLSLVLDLPPPPEAKDLGDFVLPAVEVTASLVVADGAELNLAGGLVLSVPAGATGFPGFEAENDVGAVRVPEALVPFELPGEFVAAYAFHPFDTRFTTPATATINRTLLLADKDREATIRAYANEPDEGGLVELPTTDAGEFLTTEISYLTWLVFCSQ
jgi:hypothetical protein